MMECNVYKTVKTISLSQKTVELVVFSVLTYCKKQGVVSVHFIGDKKMRRLNFQHRGKDNTTDVLSFSMQEGKVFPGQQDDLGDMFVSVPQIRRQAKTYAVSYKSEIIRMLIHGTLHLLGYDHIKKKEAEEMFRIQEELHRRFI